MIYLNQRHVRLGHDMAALRADLRNSRPPPALGTVLQSKLFGRAQRGRVALTSAAAVLPSAAPIVSEAVRQNAPAVSRCVPMAHSSFARLDSLSAGSGAGHWHITEQRIDLTRRVMFVHAGMCCYAVM